MIPTIGRWSTRSSSAAALRTGVPIDTFPACGNVVGMEVSEEWKVSDDVRAEIDLLRATIHDGFARTRRVLLRFAAAWSVVLIGAVWLFD